MSFQQILILAILATAGLAGLRIVRVLRFGRTPLPDGPGRKLFFLGFLVVPPLALGGLGAVAPYIAVVATLVALMWIVAAVIDRPTIGEAGRLARLALVGNEGDLIEGGAAPITARLSQSVGLVTRANARFPRGLEFPKQIDRSGFRDDWDSLENATRTLESRIAEDRQRGLGVAATATTVAQDARSRLDTLRRLAGDHGQAWAGTPA